MPGWRQNGIDFSRILDYDILSLNLVTGYKNCMESPRGKTALICGVAGQDGGISPSSSWARATPCGGLPGTCKGPVSVIWWPWELRGLSKRSPWSLGILGRYLWLSDRVNQTKFIIWQANLLWVFLLSNQRKPYRAQ